MPQITFHYPTWLLIIILAAALGYAALLYFRSSSFDSKGKWLKSLLAFVRVMTVSAIGILLLGPLLQANEQLTKDPTIVIIEDASQSVGTWDDQSDTRVSERIRQLVTSLSGQYHTERYLLGDRLRSLDVDTIAYDDAITDITTAIEDISDIYEGDNLGAVIIATDGLYNQGRSPLYAQYRHTAPIHTIALGDTSRYSDLSIRQVLHNEIGYLNDQMIIQVDVQAHDARGQVSQVILQRLESGRYVDVARRQVRIDREDYFETINFTIELETAGVVRYRAVARTLPDEKNITNNSRNIYIEVLDARQQILILANAPHPDIAAIRSILEQNKNYEVEITYDLPSAAQISEIDLMILHDLPSQQMNISGVISQLDRRQTPRMYIIGGGASLSRFNQVQDAISISSSAQSTNTVSAAVADDFFSYQVSDLLVSRLPQYPPLNAPFGEYSISPDTDVLLYQQIGSVRTDYPLLAYSDRDGTKSAYLMGEGIWQWKYYDYAREENFALISELLDRSALYTTTVEDKRKFRVSSSQRVYNESETVRLSAELYNDSYELISDAEIRLQLTDDEGSQFDYTFSPGGRGYALTVGTLDAGEYRYIGSTVYDGEQHTAMGNISVREVQYEAYVTQADHELLYTLSSRTGGQLYYPARLDELQQTLTASSALKPIVYNTEKIRSIMDYKWIFVLLTLLLGVEWILRRYHGTL